MPRRPISSRVRTQLTECRALRQASYPTRLATSGPMEGYRRYAGSSLLKYVQISGPQPILRRPGVRDLRNCTRDRAIDSSQQPPTAEQAATYIARFCKAYNLGTQCSAARTAALSLPLHPTPLTRRVVDRESCYLLRCVQGLQQLCSGFSISSPVCRQL